MTEPYVLAIYEERLHRWRHSLWNPNISRGELAHALDTADTARTLSSLEIGDDWDADLDALIRAVFRLTNSKPRRYVTRSMLYYGNHDVPQWVRSVSCLRDVECAQPEYGDPWHSLKRACDARQIPGNLRRAIRVYVEELLKYGVQLGKLEERLPRPHAPVQYVLAPKKPRTERQLAAIAKKQQLRQHKKDVKLALSFALHGTARACPELKLRATDSTVTLDRDAFLDLLLDPKKAKTLHAAISYAAHTRLYPDNPKRKDPLLDAALQGKKP